MNLNTLARLAGVSVATVSKAFSGSTEISEETRDRIFSLAREHGCFDKYNKNKFSKQVIAVICPELNSDYYNAMITLLDREIRKLGNLMTVSVSDFSPEREQELFAYYTSYCKADGIIVVNPHGTIDNPLRIPAVAIGTRNAGDNIDVIYSDLSDVMNDVVQYLQANGHTDVGFVGEPLTMGKLELFEQALQTAGISLPEKWIKISADRFEKAGIRAVDALLAQGSLPTAILAAYDYIAIGIIKELRRHGIRVPEEVSVIGMDDIAHAPYLETALSSIRTHTDDACRIAVELIAKKMENQYFSPRQDITVSSEFIPRASSGVAPNYPRR